MLAHRTRSQAPDDDPPRGATGEEGSRGLPKRPSGPFSWNELDEIPCVWEEDGVPPRRERETARPANYLVIVQERFSEAEGLEPSVVPVVVASLPQLLALELDARAGFLLSRIDGVLSVEQLLDVSGMSATETMRVLESFVSSGVIGSTRPRER